MPRKLTMEEVKIKLKEIHGDEITLDESTYVNGRTFCKFVVDGLEKYEKPTTILKQYRRINCFKCNKIFISCRLKTKFCSKPCASEWHMQNNDKVKLTKNNLKHNHNIPKFKNNCNQCGIEYEVQNKRKNITKFCSRKCASLSTYNKIKDKLISNAKTVCTGRIAVNKNKPHSKEAVLKITQASLSRGNSFYGVQYNPYVDKKQRTLNLKSSYEIAFVEEFLDKNNIEWEYEPTYFTLSNGKYYYPDFYLPNLDKWYEVKGFINHVSVNKFHQFRKDYPNINIEMLTKKELCDNFGIDLSAKNIKKIMKTWRKYV